MVLYTMLFAAEATKNSSTVEILKVLIPAIIGALATWGGLALQKKFSNEDRTHKEKQDAYDRDLEQTVKQREFIIKENEELWKVLKQDLDAVKVEKSKLEGQIAILRDRMLKVEADLAAWEMGLKTPKGFRLVKIDEAPPNRIKDNRSKGDL